AWGKRCHPAAGAAAGDAAGRDRFHLVYQVAQGEVGDDQMVLQVWGQGHRVSSPAYVRGRRMALFELRRPDLLYWVGEPGVGPMLGTATLQPKIILGRARRTSRRSDVAPTLWICGQIGIDPR